jgi:hypothetical protein
MADTTRDPNPLFGADDVSVTQDPDTNLEKLGRQRPDVFPNVVFEVMFCSSLLVSMLMAVR